VNHDDELISMAGGDRSMAKAVRASLQRLRDGIGGPEMQEMARDVLEGRSTLRQVGRSEVYGGAFREQFRKLAQWRAEVGEEEYQAHMERARQRLDEAAAAE
jgi:hypothetical protein